MLAKVLLFSFIFSFSSMAIVGGYKEKRNPSMAWKSAVGIVNNSGEIFCSGTYLDSGDVATAGHCLLRTGVVIHLYNMLKEKPELAKPDQEIPEELFKFTYNLISEFNSELTFYIGNGARGGDVGVQPNKLKSLYVDRSYVVMVIRNMQFQVANGEEFSDHFATIPYFGQGFDVAMLTPMKELSAAKATMIPNKYGQESFQKSTEVKVCAYGFSRLIDLGAQYENMGSENFDDSDSGEKNCRDYKTKGQVNNYVLFGGEELSIMPGDSGAGVFRKASDGKWYMTGIVSVIRGGSGSFNGNGLNVSIFEGRHFYVPLSK